MKGSAKAMSNLYEKCRAAAQEIALRLKGKIPQTAVVLGSGLGVLADQVEDPVRIPYTEIPNFPEPTVASHKGELLCGSLAGRPVLLLNGRFHYYEGYTTAEIGRMLKVPTNTVLSWLRRARAQLQTMLKEEIEDEVV